MKTQKFKININTVKYVLENDLYIEYFVFLFCKSKCDTSGKFPIEWFSNSKICNSTLKKHLCDNLFYSLNGNKEFIYLKSFKNLPFSVEKFYTVSFDEITPYASKLATGSGKKIKQWNSTTIKYFFISIFAAQYEYQKPYALELISKDIKVAISTIQRALKAFDVQKTHKVQKKSSPRGYNTKHGFINMTANYYMMPIGSFFKISSHV